MLIAMNRRLLKRRGLTFTEMMIAVAVFSVIGIFVSYVALATARRSRVSLSGLPADAAAFRTTERLRSLLMPAELGSLAVSSSGDEVTFRNPSVGATSRIFFDAQTRECIYVPDILGRESNVISRDVEGTFEIERIVQKRVRINVTAEAQTYPGQSQLTYSDVVTVRN